MHFPENLRVLINDGQCYGNLSNPGPDFFLLNYLVQMLHFNFEILQTVNNTDELDILLRCASVEKYIYQYLDYSAPYYSHDVIFVTEKAKDHPKFEVFMRPFTIGVWIFGFVLAIAATLTVKRVTSSKASFVHTLLSMLGSMLKQPLRVELSSLERVVCWTSWLIWAGSISSLYSALFLSFLLVPGKQPGVKNFPELMAAVRDKTYRCAVPGNAGNTILEAMNNSEDLKIMAESAIENDLLYTLLDFQGMGGLIDTNTAVIGARDQAEIAALYPPHSIKVYSEDILYTFHVAIGVRKDFCCKEQLDAAVLSAVSAGLTQKWFCDFINIFKWKLAMQMDAREERMNAALTLEDLKYVFLLLLMGYALSFIIFMCEMISVSPAFKKYTANCFTFYKRKKKKKRVTKWNL